MVRRLLRVGRQVNSGGAARLPRTYARTGPRKLKLIKLEGPEVPWLDRDDFRPLAKQPAGVARLKQQALVNYGHLLHTGCHRPECAKIGDVGQESEHATIVKIGSSGPDKCGAHADTQHKWPARSQDNLHLKQSDPLPADPRSVR